MTKVCVVTGGGSSIGFAGAKEMGKDHHIILMGRTVSKLEGAIKELTDLGYSAESYPGDASDVESVKKLAKYAKSKGEVDVVIHAAGVSPVQADYKKLIEINAIGTINVDTAFAEVMDEGSVILNLSSSAAYLLPESMLPVKQYALALENVDAFREEIIKYLETLPEEKRTPISYPVSKNFVKWYTEQMAVILGPKKIRVVSLAPGVIKTDMSVGEASSQKIADASPSARMGTTEEIGRFMNFMIRDGFITGVDYLYDGGSIANNHAVRK